MSAPETSRSGNGCLGVAGVLAGVMGGIFVGTPLLFAGALTLFQEAPAPTPQPVDSLAAIGVDSQGGSFYASVKFADDSVLWLGSSDGGATWTKVAAPRPYPTSASRGTALVCASGNVCYLSHTERSDGGSQRNLVDRLDPDHTWRTELSKGAECSAQRLVVDPGDGDRAMVMCDIRTIARREPDGTWKTVDLVEIASSLR
ncbi:MAG: sialidase family protein [Propionicimonas sp.]|uniref:hypothetical protein n=1 Tax=Propionicimonas sp. TaxID=1955623 RepID=UPI003D12E9A2